MDGQGESDDAQFLDQWRATRDKENERQLLHIQEIRLLIKQEVWVPGDADDLKFLQEKNVSNIEWLSTIFRFQLRKRRQVVVTLGAGIVRVYIYRLPRNEEEARTIHYILTLLQEERERDKEMIEELLPRFERHFEFVNFLLDYNKETMPSNSEIYREIMKYLVNREGQRNETGREENSSYPENAGT